MLAFFEIIVGYLIGSICSAVIISRLCGLPDPLEEGSKNPGATNMLRLAGKKYAVIVLFADILKGLLPVLAAKLLGASPNVLGFVSLAAVLGHVYPIFFKFKGGKGVATALGAILGLNFLLGVTTIATWLLLARFTRYSSVASITATLLVPFYSLTFFHNASTFMPLLFIAILILYKHHQNITRLFNGQEPQINLKKHRNSTKKS